VANIAVHFGADGAIKGASLNEVNLKRKRGQQEAGSQNLEPEGPEEASVAWLPSGVYLTRPIVGKRRRGEVAPGCVLPPWEVRVRAESRGVNVGNWGHPRTVKRARHTYIQCNATLPGAAYGRQKWIVRVGRRFRGKTAYTAQGRVVEYSVNRKSGIINNRRSTWFARTWKTPAGIFGYRVGNTNTSQQGPSLVASVRGGGGSAEVVASTSTGDVTRVLAAAGDSVGRSGVDAHSASDVAMGEACAEDAPTSVAAEAPVSTEVDMGEAPLGDGRQKNEVSQEMELDNAEPGPIQVVSEVFSEVVVCAGEGLSGTLEDGDDEDLPDAEEANVETAVEGSQVELSTVVEAAAEVSGEKTAGNYVPPSSPATPEMSGVMSEVSVGYAVGAVPSSSECLQGPSQTTPVESSSTAVAPGVASAPASSPDVAPGVARSSLLASQPSAVPNAADNALALAMGSVNLRETDAPTQPSTESELDGPLSGLTVSNSSHSNPLRKDREMSKRLSAVLASKTSARKSGGVQKLVGSSVEGGRKSIRAMMKGKGRALTDKEEAEKRRTRRKMPFYESDSEEELEEEEDVVQVVAKDDGEEEGDSDTPAVEIVLGDDEEL